MAIVRHTAFALAVGCGLIAAPAVFAQTDAAQDLLQQQEKQRQIQADTEQVVRRLSTMIRVMQFYGTDKDAQADVLGEMKTTLAGLSKNQMTAVIDQLEEAAKARDTKQSEKALDAAYTSHRKVIDTLRDMLARYDAVKSLDQAADRFEKLAKHQLELHLQTGQLIRDQEELNDPRLAPTKRMLVQRRMRGQARVDPSRWAVDAQTELSNDAGAVYRQVVALRSSLPAEQQQRVKAMEKLAAEFRVLENLERAAQQFNSPYVPYGSRSQNPYNAARVEKYRSAGELQWQSAGQLQTLARVLRLPGDPLNVLREARKSRAGDRQAGRAQRRDEGRREEGRRQGPECAGAEKFGFPELNRLPNSSYKTQLQQAMQDAVKAEKAAELGKKQAELQFNAKDTADVLKPVAPKASKTLDGAEQAMKNAKDALAKNDTKTAESPQKKAVAELRDVKKQLDDMIAKAEKEKNDPLAALKKAAEELNKVIKDQTDTRDQTKQTAQDKQNVKTPELAAKQKDLAARTEDLKNTPLPNKDKVAPALDQAKEAMKQAAKALDAQKSPDALPKQEQALKALAKAKAELDQKIAEVEKRRDDMAKLEKAGEKLDQLLKKENAVADKASDAAKKQDAAAPKANQDLAKEQAKVTPPTTDLAKEIKDAAPKAAEKVADSTKNMEAAKQGLEKNQAKPAANEAKEAANKLADAKKALNDKLNEMKGKEIADQAALKNTDPMATAQQVAKALEEAQKAAELAKQAEQQAGDNLAKKQAEIAKQADRVNLDKASKEAAKAADALKQGDIDKALKEQQKALAQLQEDTKNPPMPMANDAKAGEPMPTEAKAGEPMAAEAKAGEPKAGEPKAGDLKATEPKAAQTGEAKEQGEPKAGQQPAQAKQNMAEAAEVKAGAPKAGEPKNAQAKAGQPKGSQKNAQAKAGKAKTGQAKNTPPKGAQAKAKSKSSQPKTGAEGCRGQGR